MADLGRGALHHGAAVSSPDDFDPSRDAAEAIAAIKYALALAAVAVIGYLVIFWSVA